MKTINKIQKTVLSTVITTGLVIAGLTVDSQNADNSNFNNSGNGNFAMITKGSNRFLTNTLEFSKNFTESGSYAEYFVKETDEPLLLEDWMTNGFDASESIYMEAETDNPMEIEGWMTEENNFERHSAYMENEVEEELGIENWMLDETYFDVDVITETIDSNQRFLLTGDYLFDMEIFKAYDNSLKIESWMLTAKAWK